MVKRIKEIYSYRTMIFSLVKRDLKGRYKGSALGFLWTFINPLLQLAVYTMVFSVIMRNGIKDYYLFLFVALIPWIFFSTSLSGGASCIWAQKDMVKKIYFPREVLPISFVTSQFINMLLCFVVIFGVLIVMGKPINMIAILYLPIIMIIEYLLSLGVALIASSITVFFRDVEYILGIITMAWQFLTPILYSIDQVPENIRFIFRYNPMSSVIIAYRDILYYGKPPQITTLTSAVGLGIALFIIGWVVFDRLQRRFAEEL